ncbi:SDR family NAD(P)-dependent oxidoreductase [Aestuariibius insulae]|uniref:SDR family NAD(P)-dependent oxidoreductase n=1 Tax=Aestuariibius insulae TaxID=2058287 RepID=UPI00345E1513
MERALIIGASGGIGSAIAQEAEQRGAEVTRISRTQDGLDVTDEASVEQILGALEGPFDLIFVATGALVVNGHEPEKAFSSVTFDGFADQFAVNAIGPALVLKHSLRLLPKDRRSVFAALSARVGSIGDNKIGGWHAYRAAKAALNQILHGAAIEMRRTHKQGICVALHPGTVETPFTAEYAGRHKTVSAGQAAADLLDVVADLSVQSSGGFYDYSGAEIPW